MNLVNIEKVRGIPRLSGEPKPFVASAWKWNKLRVQQKGWVNMDH